MSKNEVLRNKEELLEIGSVLSKIENNGIILSEFIQDVLFKMLKGNEKNERLKGV
ncbi:MAG: hypothetical protein RR585_05405 [Coprobacillus sp.]